MLEYDYGKMYDSFLGVNTKEPDYDDPDKESMPEAMTGIIKEAGTITEADYYRYEATPFDALQVTCQQLSIKQTDCVVDFGCGKGRVLFFFNNFYLCRVKGIEYDDELYETLLDNVAYYSVRFHGREEQIETYHMRAEDYEIKKEDNIFYFFNPCAPEYFETILEHIILSIEDSPRRVTLVLYYCSDEYTKILRDMQWKQRRLIRLPGYSADPYETMYLFQNPL